MARLDTDMARQGKIYFWIRIMDPSRIDADWSWQGIVKKISRASFKSETASQLIR